MGLLDFITGSGWIALGREQNKSKHADGTEAGRQGKSVLESHCIHVGEESCGAALLETPAQELACLPVQWNVL